MKDALSTDVASVALSNLHGHRVTYVDKGDSSNTHSDGYCNTATLSEDGTDDIGVWTLEPNDELKALKTADNILQSVHW